MAATAQVTRVPVEVYLKGSYEPDAEYVDGIIEERSMGEWDHSDWQAAILEFFRSKRHEWNIRAAAELRVQVAARQFSCSRRYRHGSQPACGTGHNLSADRSL